MAKSKNIIIYLLLVCGVIIVVYWTVQKGKVLEIKSNDLPLKAILDASLAINLKNPLAILLSQVIAIIL